jgi:hypothetical protein
MANNTSKGILPCAARPQKTNAEKEELMADIAVTTGADRWKRLLSLKKPKKVEEQIPGILIKVRRSVENVGDRSDTLRAYSVRYVCGIPYPALCKRVAIL